MLTEEQIQQVWDRRISADVYTLYFGDFASRYSQQKQWITFGSFFLSSGAAATVIAKSPWFLPAFLSVLVALATAYSVAMGLDSRIRTTAKLHYSWSQISADYARLWNELYADDSVERFHDLIRRERDLSELATTDAPNDQKALTRWQEQVWKLYRLETA